MNGWKKLLFDLLGIVGAILLIIGPYLAWAVVPSLPAEWNTLYGYSLGEGAMLMLVGFLAIIAAIITAIVPTRLMSILMIVIGLVALLVCIYDLASLSVIVYGPHPPATGSEYAADAGIGLYLCLIGSILILVSGLVLLIRIIKKIEW